MKFVVFAFALPELIENFSRSRDHIKMMQLCNTAVLCFRHVMIAYLKKNKIQYVRVCFMYFIYSYTGFLNKGNTRKSLCMKMVYKSILFYFHFKCRNNRQVFNAWLNVKLGS
jgi:hypothetical protein